MCCLTTAGLAKKGREQLAIEGETVTAMKEPASFLGKNKAREAISERSVSRSPVRTIAYIQFTTLHSIVDLHHSGSDRRHHLQSITVGPVYRHVRFLLDTGLSVQGQLLAAPVVRGFCCHLRLS